SAPRPFRAIASRRNEGLWRWLYAVALPVQANTNGEGCSERLARHVRSILRQVFVEIFVGNQRLSTGESCVARLRHRPRFAAGQPVAGQPATGHPATGQPGRRTPRHLAFGRRASSSGGARFCARSQAVSPRATTVSASRSLSPYVKWLAMFSENRLASVTRPTASAPSRMCVGVAPQQTPM